MSKLPEIAATIVAGRRLQMRFETREMESGKTVITIAGKLVWGDRDVDLLESGVKNLLDHGRRTFVFDLAALDYADSSGMGALISCFAQIKNSGGDLRLVGAKPRIQKLFQFARVNDILSAYPKRAKAGGGCA